MELIVANHPLVATKLTRLRARETPSPVFRQLVDELVTLLAYEATRNVRTAPWKITTPVAPTVGVRLADPYPLIVPILRAGLGMLGGITRLIPAAEVGFLGMVRDEETLEPFTYAERLPADIAGRQVFILDPMLATGGSLTAAIEFMANRGASDVTAICLLAAPEGVARCHELSDKLHLTLTLVVAGVDEQLNEKGYIVPGLGDAGDRLYGLVD
ncbi:MAG: uracil phosphoribosyltransferase [Propionibacteriaceae bacterium]|jgi:uracil phosphoribosyltransferase|nr:uracil phosphoribosyltransferase [Propionibacteriaceae bacterium]